MNEIAAPAAAPAPGDPDADAARRLAVLFAVMYFVQGIAEPTEGLLAQPIRSLMRQAGFGTASIAHLMLVLTIPWSVKPLFGLLTDFVPLAGSRRRIYLLLATSTTAACLTGFAGWHPQQPGFAGLVWWLLPATIGVAFADVVTDALMIELGQPRGLTGRLQSVQWTALYAAGILTGAVGGFLSQHRLQHVGLLLCAGASGFAFLLAWFRLDEPRELTPRTWADVRAEIGRAIALAPLRRVALFLFLLSFNPFWSTVRYTYYVRDLGFSEQFYGNLMSLQALAAVGASIAYGVYCRRLSPVALEHAAIGVGIVCTLAYGFVVDERSALVAAVAVGFTFMTANLIQLDLAARICPPALAGTVFALLMSLCNLSDGLATSLGGWLYDGCRDAWGATRSYQQLVAIGAACTAACWACRPLAANGAQPERE